MPPSLSPVSNPHPEDGCWRSIVPALDLDAIPIGTLDTASSRVSSTAISSMISSSLAARSLTGSASSLPARRPVREPGRHFVVPMLEPGSMTRQHSPVSPRGNRKRRGNDHGYEQHGKHGAGSPNANDGRDRRGLGWLWVSGRRCHLCCGRCPRLRRHY